MLPEVDANHAGASSLLWVVGVNVASAQGEGIGGTDPGEVIENSSAEHARVGYSQDDGVAVDCACEREIRRRAGTGLERSECRVHLNRQMLKDWRTTADYNRTRCRQAPQCVYASATIHAEDFDVVVVQPTENFSSSVGPN